MRRDHTVLAAAAGRAALAAHDKATPMMMMKKLWEDLKLFLFLTILFLSIMALPSSIVAIYNQYNKASHYSEMRKSRAKTEAMLCQTYRHVWHWLDHNPHYSAYVKPDADMERDWCGNDSGS